MERSVDKFYVLIPENGRNSELEIISAVHGVNEKMYYEDGNWLVGEKKKIEQISPDDVRLRQHYIKIISEKDKSTRLYECGLCGKDFKIQNTLKRHMPVHTDVRKYECHICNKAFRQRNTLSQHLSTHGNKLRHKCLLCSKSFVRMSTLIAHRKTHTDEKPFVCHYCSKAFHQRVNLISHIYTHTGETPFKCDQCGKSFNQKSNLNAHKKKLHSAVKESQRAAQMTTTEPEIPNPIPSTSQNIIHNRNITQQINPSLADTILTVVKETPPYIMDKALKCEKIFALYVENDGVSMMRIVVRVVCIENDECALVRINKSDRPDDRVFNVVWVVLKENDQLYTLNDTNNKKELKFCDDLKGMNIHAYIKSRSGSHVDSSQTVNQEVEHCDNFDFLNRSTETDVSRYPEGVFQKEGSEDLFLSVDDVSTDDLDKLIELKDHDETFDEWVGEEVIEETVLEECIFESNFFCSIFKCDQCGEEFNENSILNAHKRQLHSAVKESKRAALMTTTEPEILNPIPSTTLDIIHNRDITQQINPSLADTILTVVKETPPYPVMDKALKCEKIFALYVENDGGLIMRNIVRIVCIENDECALVRIKKSDCPDDRVINVVWVVLRENDQLYTLNDINNKKELKFCDDLKGRNINDYMKSTVNQEVEHCDNFDFLNRSTETDVSRYPEGVFQEEGSEDLFLSDDVSTDDLDQLIVLEDQNVDETFDEWTREEVVIEESVLEECIDDSNLFCSDDTPLVWHLNPRMLDDGGDIITKEDIENREDIA